MPYKSKDELPEPVQALPEGAQDIYLAAFNSAYDQLKGEPNQEPRAHAIAWAAVKQKYVKRGDKWHAKPGEADTDLATLHGDLLREFGRRNASADEARIRKIIELANELLTTEDADTSEARAQIEEGLAWLREQPLARYENGTPHEAQEYAYVPSDDPDTWRLRIYEGGRLHPELLDRAARALSPGALHQNGIRDPEPVRRKVRAAFRELGLDVPRWVRQDADRAILAGMGNVADIAEADKGIATVLVIRAGFGNPVDNYYYPPEVLRRDYGIFEGAKMYCNHQTVREESERPEGDIRQWVGNLRNVAWSEEQQAVVGEAVIHEQWMREKLTGLREVGLLSEMGISIRAVGRAYSGNVEGRKAKIVEELMDTRSVDFVTEAGAGGMVTMYERDQPWYDIDIVNLTTLRERRPDLIDEVKAESKLEANTMALEERITELEGQVATLTTERDTAQAALDAANRERVIAEARAAVDAALAEATDLPEAARKRIAARFSDTAEGIEEAIKDEREYLASVREAAKVTGMGPVTPPVTDYREKLKDGFKKLGMTDEAAEVAAKGR